MLVSLADSRQPAVGIGAPQMAKRFYIATRKDRESHANAISEALKAHGWERTFVWTAQDNASMDQFAKVAEEELNAIKDADLLIVLLPGGYGTHVEIGAALALGKTVILHSPDRQTLNEPYPCIFHYHPRVKLIVSDLVSAESILAVL